MKVAFTTSGETMQASIDPRFGRAPRFLIIETETGEIHLKENTQNLNAAPAGSTPTEVVQAYLAGTLETGANACDH